MILPPPGHLTGRQPGEPDPGWIDERSSVVVLDDGTRVLIRPILPDDKALLQEGIQHLSPQSIYLRFLHYLDRLTPSELRYLTEIDYQDHFAWVAISLDQPDQVGLGVARYIRDKTHPAQAEAAVAVIDEFQGRGLGRLLLTKLADSARENGVDAFIAYLAPESPVVNHLLHNVAAAITSTEDGLVKVIVPLGTDDPGPGSEAMLRAAAGGDAGFVSPMRQDEPG
ncbi:MAG TPA: GNAT family N-acetyltransferase [Acidimicrobiia bacterium]|nr:GNAT family N-acetyltransferase [Acidimicrobiia bacterium]